MSSGTLATRSGWAANGWSAWHLCAADALLGVTAAITHQAWGDIYHLSQGDEESSHVLLVPVAAAWLVWVRRHRFRQCRPTGRLVGTALVGAGWFLWSYGHRNDVQSFWHGGAVVMAVGAVLTVLGKVVFFRFLPAFAVLVFLVPD